MYKKFELLAFILIIICSQIFTSDDSRRPSSSKIYVRFYKSDAISLEKFRKHIADLQPQTNALGAAVVSDFTFSVVYEVDKDQKHSLAQLLAHGQKARPKSA